MKKALVLTASILILFMALSACSSAVPRSIPAPDGAKIEFGIGHMSITNEQLVELVETGEIPADVEILTLTGTGISDISPLGSLMNLQTLVLSNNDISDISPLSGLVNLVELDLDENQIRDISPLGRLTNLRGLRLEGNRISDMRPLHSLTELGWVFLYGNPFTQRVIDELEAALPDTSVFTDPAFSPHPGS